MKEKNNPNTDTSTLEVEGADSTFSTPLKKEFVEVYRAKTGNASEACRAVCIDRKTYYNWKNSDADFSAAIAAVDESLIDKAESKLMELIDKGDKTAIIFFLKTKGKERGYVERIENETYNMTPADFAQQLIDEKRKLRTQH